MIRPVTLVRPLLAVAVTVQEVWGYSSYVMNAW